MFSHPLTREMAQWWTDHGSRPDDPQWQQFLADMRSLTTGKHNELLEKHDNAGRFGMSTAGGCTRAPALKLLGYEPAPFDGDTLATFFIGHQLELMAIATLRGMGYVAEGEQEPVRIGEFMHSYSDGIIQNWPDGPAILSVKSTGYKKSGKQGGKFVRMGFPALPFDGLRKTNSGWWVQAQAEMHGSGIPRCLVVVIAKDMIKAMSEDPYMQESGSLTFYCELVEYDERFCEGELVPVWQRQWTNVTRDHSAGQPMFYNAETHRFGRLAQMADTSSGWGGPNRNVTGTFNPCYGCDIAAACKTEVANAYRSSRTTAVPA